MCWLKCWISTYNCKDVVPDSSCTAQQFGSLPRWVAELQIPLLLEWYRVRASVLIGHNCPHQCDDIKEQREECKDNLSLPDVLLQTFHAIMGDQ
jgi:hypothetical protein